jgi:N-acetylneuraminic acid mutarotase
MIVWGGLDGLFPNFTYFDTGGRYDPVTDTWTSTSTTGVPAGRATHTAVWTGREMIVWGGSAFGVRFDTGGRYNPSTDSWTATSTTDAPVERQFHTAVWTGSEMIIWGGDGGAVRFNDCSRCLSRGSRYCAPPPATPDGLDTRIGCVKLEPGPALITRE